MEVINMRTFVRNLSKELKICGIYKITSPSNKIYIGQSNDIRRRLLTYYEPKGGKSQLRLKSSFEKYGLDEHFAEIIEECDESLLNTRERYWQDFYNTSSVKGLNCKLTKTIDKSGSLSTKTKRAIQNALKGTTKTCKSSMKRVNQYDLNGNFIDEYESARQASRKLKIDCASISKCCNNKGYKSAGGFIFKYKNNEEAEIDCLKKLIELTKKQK